MIDLAVAKVPPGTQIKVNIKVSYSINEEPYEKEMERTYTTAQQN